MQMLTAITVLLSATACMGVETESIDVSIVFKRSQVYFDIKKRNPDQRHLLMEDSRSPEWVQVAIVEDHPTHVVAIERFRVYANGRIEKLILKADGEEAWIPDNRPEKIPSEQD
jgi:hypothetical protein